MSQPSLQFARYYDLQPDPFDGKDIAFFASLIRKPKTSILDLGCGTGRVLIRLARYCEDIEGLDSSGNMIAVCREKLRAARLANLCECVHIGDMAAIDLGRQFELILVPFYGFQLLLDKGKIDSFFKSVSEHMSPDGSCIVTAFNPWSCWEGMESDWRSMKSESVCWETGLGSGRLVCFEKVNDVDGEARVCHFTLTCRYFERDTIVNETAIVTALRCYYPAELEALIGDHGFKIIGQWGGYSGEKYGEAEELIIQFSHREV